MIGLQKHWKFLKKLLSEGKVSATTSASERTSLDTHRHVPAEDEDASASEETNLDNHPNAPDTASETARLDEYQHLPAEDEDASASEETNLDHHPNAPDTASETARLDEYQHLPVKEKALETCWSKRKLLPSEIGHLPTLQDGEDYFPIFVHRKKMVRLYSLFSGEKAVALTCIGRKSAKRLLKFILRVHKEGKCWHGNWDILDVRVQMGGAELIIAKKAEPATSDGMCFDLQNFIEHLVPYYRIEGSRDPAFFDAFRADVMMLPDPESERFDLFQKFLADHLAFMPPLARSDLFDKPFRVCDSLRDGDRGYEVLCAKPLVGDAPEWTKKVKYLEVYANFFFHRPGVDSYDDTHWELLRFVRNFSNHAHKYSKVDGVEKVMDIIAYGLMISNELGYFMTNLLLNLMYDCKMEGRDESVENDEDDEN